MSVASRTPIKWLSRGCFFTQIRCMAGHSKWANIKHIKGEKDGERARITNRIVRLMRTCIKETGSADPKHNLRLAHIIEQARQNNIPVEKIQQVLVGSSKDDSKPGLLEIRGPGGCYMIVDILTNNISRTRYSVGMLLKKYQATWADGASNHAFNYKGVIKVEPISSHTTLEQAIEIGIEAGAEDVEIDEGNFVFTSQPIDFLQVKSGIEQAGYKVIDSNLVYVPQQKIALNEHEMEQAYKLYEKLEEDPDVVKVHDNIS